MMELLSTAETLTAYDYGDVGEMGPRLTKGSGKNSLAGGCSRAC